jgi:acetyl-CoA synthetase
MSEAIQSMQKEGGVFEPADWVRERAWIQSREQYEEMYKRSVEDPEGFWGEQAEEFLYWHKKWDSVLEWEFDTPKI